MLSKEPQTLGRRSREPSNKPRPRARKGAESTRHMIAKYGRAKFLGEKTRGSADAGATSIALLFHGFSVALGSKKEA